MSSSRSRSICGPTPSRAQPSSPRPSVPQPMYSTPPAAPTPAAQPELAHLAAPTPPPRIFTPIFKAGARGLVFSNEAEPESLKEARPYQDGEVPARSETADSDGGCKYLNLAKVPPRKGTPYPRAAVGIASSQPGVPRVHGDTHSSRPNSSASHQATPKCGLLGAVTSSPRSPSALSYHTARTSNTPVTAATQVEISPPTTVHSLSGTTLGDEIKEACKDASGRSSKVPTCKESIKSPNQVVLTRERLVQETLREDRLPSPDDIAFQAIVREAATPIRDDESIRPSHPAPPTDIPFDDLSSYNSTPSPAYALRTAERTRIKRGRDLGRLERLESPLARELRYSVFPQDNQREEASRDTEPATAGTGTGTEEENRQAPSPDDTSNASRESRFQERLDLDGPATFHANMASNPNTHPSPHHHQQHEIPDIPAPPLRRICTSTPRRLARKLTTRTKVAKGKLKRYARELKEKMEEEKESLGLRIEIGKKEVEMGFGRAGDAVKASWVKIRGRGME